MVAVVPLDEQRLSLRHMMKTVLNLLTGIESTFTLLRVTRQGHETQPSAVICHRDENIVSHSDEAH